MEVFVLLVLFGLVSYGLWYLKSPAFKGAMGERRVNSALRRHLSDDYQVFADLTLPSRGGTTQIDHVVISPFGVFVIETKNMTGWIFGGENQGTWTQTIYQHKTRFQNPLRQNYKHVKAIEEATGVSTDCIYNLVVFAGDAKPKTSMPPNVVWSGRGLSKSIKAQKEVLFDEEEISSISAKLSNEGFQSNDSDKRAHIAHLKQVANSCPKCGSNLVLRENKQGNRNFYGCSQFPRCRGTRPAA